MKQHKTSISVVRRDEHTLQEPRGLSRLKWTSLRCSDRGITYLARQTDSPQTLPARCRAPQTGVCKGEYKNALSCWRELLDRRECLGRCMFGPIASSANLLLQPIAVAAVSAPVSRVYLPARNSSPTLQHLDPPGGATSQPARIPTWQKLELSI